MHFETVIDPAILKAVLIVAGNSDVRNYLCGVRIEADKTGTKAIATDGHRMIVAQVDSVRTDPPVGFTIERTMLEGALKIYGKLPTVPLKFEHPELPEVGESVNHGTVTVGTLQTENHAAGFYPQWRQLVPESVSGEPGQFNASYLADFAKARKLLGQSALFPILHNGPNNAAIVHLRADVLGMVMPYREAEVEYSRPAWVDYEIPEGSGEQFAA